MSELKEKVERIAAKLREFSDTIIALKEELVTVNQAFVDYQNADAAEDADYQAQVTVASARVAELEAQLAAKPADNVELAQVIDQAYVAAGFEPPAPVITDLGNGPIDLPAGTINPIEPAPSDVSPQAPAEAPVEAPVEEPTLALE